jgi:hypothetical protein
MPAFFANIWVSQYRYINRRHMWKRKYSHILKVRIFLSSLVNKALTNLIRQVPYLHATQHMRLMGMSTGTISASMSFLSIAKIFIYLYFICMTYTYSIVKIKGYYTSTYVISPYLFPVFNYIHRFILTNIPPYIHKYISQETIETVSNKCYYISTWRITSVWYIQRKWIVDYSIPRVPGSLSLRPNRLPRTPSCRRTCLFRSDPNREFLKE